MEDGEWKGKIRWKKSWVGQVLEEAKARVRNLLCMIARGGHALVSMTVGAVRQ